MPGAQRAIAFDTGVFIVIIYHLKLMMKSYEVKRGNNYLYNYLETLILLDLNSEMVFGRSE
jgi:hypothetical protein